MSDFELEAQLFIEGIRRRYGYDFRQYAESSVARRIQAVMRETQSRRPLDLLAKVLDDRELFRFVLGELTVTTTEMFRDPAFFRYLRENVIPILETYPNINAWVAGCSTGEELYSLSILLAEARLLDRAVIFATDINPKALKRARDGIYRSDSIQGAIANYHEAGGMESFTRYYTANYGFVKMNSDLARNVVFSEHNLAVDHVFTECHLILCRNVMIYFSRPLQNRVVRLFSDSLLYGGFVGLGGSETLAHSEAANRFDVVDEKRRIYRRNSFELRGLFTSRPADKIGSGNEKVEK